MKKLVLLLVLPAISLLADVTGKWSGAARTGDGEEQSVFLIFKQDGKTLTGSGGPQEGEQHPIQDGTVEGDRLKFKVPAGKGVILFDLKAGDEEITGEAEFKKNDGDSMTVKVTLKKVK
jgi:hypothetical protein